MERISNTLHEIDYYGDGWMQIEGAMPDGADVVESYKKNVNFLKQTFGLN